MPDPIVPPPAATPGAAPDGDHETIRSGVWVAKPFVSVEAFPESLVLTAADARLASRLSKPFVLCRRRVGAHVVELLLERGEDRSVDLALRIPTAENQFKDPYLLMEAEDGNGREIALREFQFHLQGRLSEVEVASADWPGFFAAAALKLASLRPRKAARGKATARATKPRRSLATKRRTPGRRGKRRTG